MKEFVVGSPYTSEMELTQEDEFLIIACDGVCFHSPSYRLSVPLTMCLILSYGT